MIEKSPNYPIFNALKYYQGLSPAVNNIQTMHGLTVELFRVNQKATNDYVTAFGASNVNLKSNKYLTKVGDVNILTTPQELYNVYIIGSGNSELDVYLSTKEIEVGDILRYMWTENQVLEFTVIELPKTFGDCYYQYRIKSTYQTK